MEGCAAGCGLVLALSWAFRPALDGLAGAVAGVAEALPWFFPLVAAILGASAASLVGLLVDRIPLIRGWRGTPEPGLGLAYPPSHCPGCGTAVPGLALIPVAGWFIAEGRCGRCGSRVPWAYPAVEAACALLSMAVVAVAGPTGTALALLLLLWGMLFAAWIDWNEHEIPDACTVPLFFLGLLAGPFEPDMQARALGAVLAGGLLLATFRITGAWKRTDAMSLGDVTLAAALGAWAGLCAVPTFLVCSVAAYVAYAVPFRRRGVVWVPMGPALCLGLCLAVAATRFAPALAMG